MIECYRMEEEEEEEEEVEVEVEVELMSERWGVNE
jgi:hypothetical protein